MSNDRSSNEPSNKSATNNIDRNRDQYNHSGMIAFMASMVFIFFFFIYIVGIYPGINLNEDLQAPKPGTQVAEAAADISKVTEPWVENEEMVKHGKKLYAQNCAMCHGKTGLGDGDAGKALKPAPRNLVEGPWTKGGGLIGWYKVATEGLPGTSMASYAHFPSIDRWALAQYIGSITNAKVTEDPAKVAEFAKTAK